MTEITNHDTKNNSTKNLILSFASYLALFVGTGFISGAIVHSGDVNQIPKYALIGIVGVSLFLVGSSIQEFVLNKNTQKTGIIKFFFFSLLLSIGIGMISGGTQHFSDFPVYSSFLIPIGLIVSLLAFIFKNDYKISNKSFAGVLGVFVMISSLLFFGLNNYANSLIKSDSCGKTSFMSVQVLASSGHSEAECSNPELKQDNSIKAMSPMPVTINGDQSFLEEMIPHHQEAVDSSVKLLTTTANPELKTLAQNVIKAQTQEITDMKSWYKTWFNQDYKASSSYMNMMDGITTKVGGDLDKAYITGMISHHKGAIEMAKAIQKTTKRVELNKFSEGIISTQSIEVESLKKLLVPIYTDESQTHSH